MLSILVVGFKPANVLAVASKILRGKDECYTHQLIEWLTDLNFEWRLCYRASVDGWGAKNFHSKCDDKGPTVVLVQVGKFIFGGFTDTNWSVARRGKYSITENCSVVQQLYLNISLNNSLFAHDVITCTWAPYLGR